jgi:hypothetical protein
MLLAHTLALFAMPALASQPDWSKLPASITPVFTHRSDVPAFPEKALSVREWPRERVFDGQKYVLRFSGMDWGAIREVDRLGDVPPGWAYGAHYQYRRRDGSWSPHRGPAYYWRSDSTLKERGWIGPYPTWSSWSYDSTGALVQFQQQLPANMQVTHFFGVPDGELVALIAGRRAYWLGFEMPVIDVMRKVNEYYLSVPRNR